MSSISFFFVLDRLTGYDWFVYPVVGIAFCTYMLDIFSIPALIISAGILMTGCIRSEYAHVRSVSMSSISGCWINTSTTGEGLALNMHYNDIALCELMRENTSDLVLVWYNPWKRENSSCVHIDMHDPGTIADDSGYYMWLICAILKLWVFTVVGASIIYGLHRHRVAEYRARVGAVKKDREIIPVV